MPDRRVFGSLAWIAHEEEMRAADEEIARRIEIANSTRLRHDLVYGSFTTGERVAADEFIRERMAQQYASPAQYRRMIMGSFVPNVAEPEDGRIRGIAGIRGEIRGEWHGEILHPGALRPPAPVPLPPIDDTRETMTQRIGYAYATLTKMRERNFNLPIRFLDSYYTVANVLHLSTRTAQQLQGEAYAGARGDEIAPPKRHDVMVFMEKIAVAMRQNCTDACTIETLTIPGRLAQRGFDEVAIYIGNVPDFTVYYDVEVDDYFIDSIDNMKKKVGYR